MRQEEHNRGISRRRPALLTLVASLLIFMALTQCRTSEVVQEQPTRRPAAVAGEGGEADFTYLPIVARAEEQTIAAYPPPTVGGENAQQSPQEAALFSGINAQRAQAGCPGLELSSSLAQAAHDHVLDMAQHNFFSHTGSDGSKPADRAKRDGYEHLSGFETITAGQDTPEAALAAWIGSQVHRDILLNCSLQDAGPGFVLDTDGNGFKYYWAMLLGKR
jgi:uncharacterized protein YkwD